MIIRVIWDKLVLEAKKEPDGAAAALVLALERSLEEYHEQPLEMALRLLTFTGATLRVAVEDLFKLIHDYNNVRAVRQELEFTISELEERVGLLQQNQRVTSITCPRCSKVITLPIPSAPDGASGESA
jgi:seryl-tRNA(Sec) selenium transferase